MLLPKVLCLVLVFVAIGAAGKRRVRGLGR
jgi:hypothetical protein